jgi:ubiquinone/menaquinone biosynthesis C-methylase UbiE
MSHDPPDTRHSTDLWSEWLLHRRHGDDPTYEPVVRRLVDRIRNRVLDGAGSFDDKTLIDVGAGDGNITFGAFERASGSMRAILVDISKPLLQHAEQRAIELGLRDRCTFLETSAERLDGVADTSADVLTTRAVLAYVPDKAAAIANFLRVLKPGGRVSIAEPIYSDDAAHLAAFSNYLSSCPVEAVSTPLRLLHRCRIAQLPSTLVEIQNNPLTNFSERDLALSFQRAGFDEIHLEFHLDIRAQTPIPWETYIDTAPRPGTPSLREAFAAHLTEEESRELEKALRPLIESGKLKTRDSIAYLTGRKPW